jgi:hypothetical protein
MLTNQPTGDGQRWGQRTTVDIPVQVAASASPAIHGHLKNLSLSGALMGTDQELRLHAYIGISIKLPETARSDTAAGRAPSPVVACAGPPYGGPGAVRDE